MSTVRKISVLAAAVLLTLTLGASVASAQGSGSNDPYVGNTTVQTTPQQPQVLSETTSQSPAVAAQTTATQSSSYLAFTGSDVALMATAGALVLVTGLGLLAVRRRRIAPIA